MPDDPELDPVPPAFREAAASVHRALLELQRQALAEAGYPPGQPLPPGLSLPWSPDLAADEFAERLLQAARIAAAEDTEFRPNHVWCFHCGSATCDHAGPGAPGEVFAGYEGTGRPVWQEFANFLQALQDQRVDLLFAPVPQLLARLVGRRTLIERQMVAFGRNSMTYRVIAQIVAGYFAIGGVPCALTGQIVENRYRRLRLQVIAPPCLREALADAPASTGSHFHRIHNALNECRHQVTALDATWQHSPTKAAREDLQQQLFAVLRKLAGSLEHKGRQAHRRTAHAEMRGAEQRPVHKAWDDFAAAGPGEFFRDNATQSIIVFGRKGRSHVFNENGRHVTSLVISPDELEHRVRRHRYTPLDAEQTAAFRAAVQAQFSGDRGEAGTG